MIGTVVWLLGRIWGRPAQPSPAQNVQKETTEHIIRMRDNAGSEVFFTLFSCKTLRNPQINFGFSILFIYLVFSGLAQKWVSKLGVT